MLFRHHRRRMCVLSLLALSFTHTLTHTHTHTHTQRLLRISTINMVPPVATPLAAFVASGFVVGTTCTIHGRNTRVAVFPARFSSTLPLHMFVRRASCVSHPHHKRRGAHAPSTPKARERERECVYVKLLGDARRPHISRERG